MERRTLNVRRGLHFQNGQNMSAKTKSGETPKQKGAEFITWISQEFLHMNGRISQRRGISFIVSFPNNGASFS